VKYGNDEETCIQFFQTREDPSWQVYFFSSQFNQIIWYHNLIFYYVGQEEESSGHSAQECHAPPIVSKGVGGRGMIYWKRRWWKKNQKY